MASRCLPSWLQSEEGAKLHWGTREHCVEIPTWLPWEEADTFFALLVTCLSVLRFVVQKLSHVCLLYPFPPCFPICCSGHCTGGK